MKRILWLTCLCCSASLLAACAGKKSHTTTCADGGACEDGGTAGAPDLSKLNSAVDGLNTKVDKLSGTANSLGTMISDVKKQVDGVVGDVKSLTDKVTALENPTIPSCSATASCIPDGISLAAAGVTDLVKQACTYEIGCCNASELAYKFGPGITSVADCTDTFVSLVNGGLSPSFLAENGPIIDTVIKLAQAYNEAQIKLSLDSKAVTKCTAELAKRECNKAATTTTTPTRCTSTTFMDSVQSACNVNVLVQGAQIEGEKCGSLPSPLPSGCMDGLVCRNNYGTTNGICAKPIAEGQRCTANEQCEPKTLFCNMSSGKCEKLAAEGESCAFIDPTFKISSSGLSRPDNTAALSVKCQRGLTCDPASSKCVASCSDGSFCQANGDNSDCPDGTICNVGENPDLAKTPWSLGVCRAPGAGGDDCAITNGSSVVLASQCTSGRCGAKASGTGNECKPALKKAGDACTAPGADILCESTRCGSDSKCAPACDFDAIKGYSCASGHYCATGELDPSRIPICEPLIASGTTCAASYADTPHGSCSSGFCNPSANQCADKVATHTACTSGRDQQCPTGEFCPVSGSGTCTDYLAKNADCTTDRDHSCGPGSYCSYNSALTPQYQCLAYGIEGGACNTALDVLCDSDLTCTTDAKCHAIGQYPDGVTCTYDAQCLHDWCTSANLCATPLADGADCDTGNVSKNRCVDGDFCKNADGATAGKCTARGSVGDACEPRFGGRDCLYHGTASPGSCILKSDTFMCDPNALDLDTVLCQGP